MQYRALGKTGLRVSAIGYGGWSIADPVNWGPQDEEAAHRAIRAAFDAGITFFDTAESYGDGLSERVLGDALRDVRDQVVIANKVSRPHYQASKMAAACDRSLTALGTDRIDLYQVHWPAPDMSADEVFEGLEKLQAQGKIRHYGVCNYGVRDMAAVLRRKKAIASNQLPYNLLFRAIEHEILPVCRKQDIPVIGYSPLMHGLLTGKYASADDVPEGLARTRHFASSRPRTRHGGPGAETETFAAIRKLQAIAGEIGESLGNVSLAWLLAQPGVASVVVGARTVFQAKRNARAGNLMLSEQVIRRMAEVANDLKQTLGPSADMWDAESRIR